MEREKYANMKSSLQKRSLGSPKVKLHLQWNFTRQTKSLTSEMGHIAKANLCGAKYGKIGNHQAK